MKKQVYIINANYYEEISKRLIAGAVNYLDENQINYKIVNVLGALEIPTSINLIYNRVFSKDFDIGFIGIGCIIRGETSHYDIVVNESAAGITKLIMDKDIIITNSILTVEDKSQAIERSKNDKTNKGYHAAEACNQLLDIKNGKF